MNITPGSISSSPPLAPSSASRSPSSTSPSCISSLSDRTSLSGTRSLTRRWSICTVRNSASPQTTSAVPPSKTVSKRSAYSPLFFRIFLSFPALSFPATANFPSKSISVRILDSICHPFFPVQCPGECWWRHIWLSQLSLYCLGRGYAGFISQCSTPFEWMNRISLSI